MYGYVCAGDSVDTKQQIGYLTGIKQCLALSDIIFLYANFPSLFYFVGGCGGS